MTWERAPEHDKRFAHGDDYAGDAWRNRDTGQIKYTVVDCGPPEHSPPSIGPLTPISSDE